MIVATYNDVATLLAFAIRVLRTVKANGTHLRMGLHSGEVAKSTWNEQTQLTHEDVYLARRLTALGLEGHLLASQRAAALFREEDDFESAFHACGRRTITPPDSIEIYNIYTRSTPVDEATDFGNDSQPLAEVPDMAIRKLHLPRQLRALKEERCSVAFYPDRSYVKLRFDFKDSEDQRASGVRIYCHKHGLRGCSFEYRSNYGTEEHQPEFKVVADDPSSDRLLVMEVSCFNEYDELLAPTCRHDVRLLRRPPLPSIKEPLGLFGWLWDRAMRLRPTSRATALVILIPLMILALYFWTPSLIAKETRERINQNYEFYKRRYWYRHDTYQSPPWEDSFLDKNLADRWAFDEGAATVVKGEGLDNVDTGAMLLQSGQRMMVAGNLGSLAFYDFRAQITFRFIEGAQAAWVLRAQPDRSTGYVFLLEQRGNDLVLNGWRYTKTGKPERLEGGPQGPILIGTCCFPNDFFDITAEINDFTIRHTITISNVYDKEVEQVRGDISTGTIPITDFVDRKEMYRCGNAGVLKPPASKMLVEYWLVTPKTFPAQPVPVPDETLNSETQRAIVR